MKTRKTTLFVAVLFLGTALVSCQNGEKHGLSTQEEEIEQCEYENAIDSIVRNTEVETRIDAVYNYLIAHPDFIDQSDNVGYHRYSCDDYETCMLWKDCGKIRVYSIPCPPMYATICYNILQLHDKRTLDTTSLQDETGQLEELCEVKDKQGEVYYIIKTSVFAIRHGNVIEEYISAFSLKNGRLKKEKLFHANGRQYDRIEVECGGLHHPPIDYANAVLISMNHFDDNEGSPAFVIAEINKNDWPSGYGLKYQWNGNWFEYVGKCEYNLDDFFL